jgi:hypothetical protein
MSGIFFLISFVLMIALVCVIGGIYALLRQQIVVDQNGQPSEIELPWFGKITTNYPSLIAVGLGIALATFVVSKLETTPEIRALPLIATLETDNLPPGSYVMVAAFPQRYLKGSQEFFQNGKGTMELQVEEPGPYTVVALSVTELGADGRPIYTVTQGPAIFDGNAGRLSFTGRLTRNHFSNGGGP